MENVEGVYVGGGDLEGEEEVEEGWKGKDRKQDMPGDDQVSEKPNLQAAEVLLSFFLEDWASHASSLSVRTQES